LSGDLIQAERVLAGPDRPTQIALRDGTMMTLGRGGDLTVDRFNNDGARRAATLQVTLARGAMRLIAGRAAADAPITIGTPAATVRVSSGVSFIRVDADGTTEVSQGAGKRTTVISASTGESRTITRNGFTLSVAADRAITEMPLGATRSAALQNALAEPGPVEAAGSRVAGFQSFPEGLERDTSQGAPGDLLRQTEALTQPLVARTAQVIATGRVVGSIASPIFASGGASGAAAATPGSASSVSSKTAAASLSSFSISSGAVDILLINTTGGITVVPVPPGFIFPPVQR
jgi:hypothetical protein